MVWKRDAAMARGEERVMCPGEGWWVRTGLPDALRLWLWRPRLRERERLRPRREFLAGRSEESAR